MIIQLDELWFINSLYTHRRFGGGTGGMPITLKILLVFLPYIIAQETTHIWFVSPQHTKTKRGDQTHKALACSAIYI